MTVLDPNKRLRMIENKSGLRLYPEFIEEYKGYGADAERKLRELCYEGVLYWITQKGLRNGFEASQLKEVFSVIPKYDRLLNELLRDLTASLYLTQKGNKYFFKEGFVPENSDWLTTAVHQFADAYPAYTAHARLIGACLGTLPEVMDGKVQATEIIFPGGNLELVSGIYNGSPQADYFNTTLATLLYEAVKQQLAVLDPGAKLKLLEVGAGTGASSVFIFDKLQPFADRIEYCYTDVSMKFLQHAKEHFSEKAPYLTTALFNIEKSPYSQSLPIGAFDVVIATNVVHATRNISETLKNIKPILKRDGVLVLNELANTEIFSTLTFGLLDGWWLYEDEEVRLNGSPGLPAENWKMLLEEEGFVSPFSFPEKNNLSQQLLIAYSDGLVLAEAQAKQMKQEKQPAKKIVKEQAVTKTMQATTLYDKIVAIAAATIKLPVEEFNIDDQFTDYGFDSILATALIKNINEALGVELKPTDVFNYPSVKQMSDYILQAFGDKLQETVITRSEEVMQEEMETEAQDDLLFSTAEQLGAKAGEKPVVPEPFASDEIVVVGMSGEFGGADNLDMFWEKLVSGTSLIEEVPADRWSASQFYSEDRTQLNKTYSKWGSFVRDIDKFDPLFFKIAGKEAEMMDPQQRFFLKHCWKAIEDAAIHPDDLRSSRCGVFVGVGPGDYMSNIRDKAASAFWGNSSAILASRISYFMDLKGPAISIDTACSSSLVALNIACSSLQRGDTDIALAGGVAIMTAPDFYVLSSRAGMLSPDGKCYAFDERANGFVPGEGVGVLVLKRRGDAERDGDHIYGLIKGSLTNQDGTTNGITAPSAVSQTSLETELYKQLGISPETISYIETHGTGTKLGDPIEFEALTNAFRAFTDKKQFCGIGSVKSNMGHALTAAGIAGVMKLLLAFRHQKLPPTIHYNKPNPLLNSERSPFFIQDKLTEWKASTGQPIRAAVSSFGFSGTNAHAVLESYPVEKDKGVSKNTTGPGLIVLSAKDENRLQDYIALLLSFVTQHPGTELSDIAFTLQTGRLAMECRFAMVVNDIDELKSGLKNYLEGEKNSGTFSGNSKTNKLDFVLKGQAGKAYLDKAIEAGEWEALAQIWVRGVDIDWKLLHQSGNAKRISLPTYPFAKERYWAEPTSKLALSNGHSALHPLLHENTSNFFSQQYTSWFSSDEPFLSGHRVNEQTVFPAAAFIVQAIEAARLAGKKEERVTVLSDLVWHRPFIVDGKGKRLTLRLHWQQNAIRYEALSEKELVYHTGCLTSETTVQPKRIDLKEIQNRKWERIEVYELYTQFVHYGITYGQPFRGIQELCFNANEALAKITRQSEDTILGLLTMLDSAFQVCAGPELAAEQAVIRIPEHIEVLRIYNALPPELWVHVKKRPEPVSEGSVLFDLLLVDAQGVIVWEVEGMRFSPVTKNEKTEKALPLQQKQPQTTFYKPEWQDAPIVKMANDWQHEQVLIVLAGGSAELAGKLKEELETEVLQVTGANEEVYFRELFLQLKQKMLSNEKVRVVVLYENQEVVQYAFIRGLFKTAQLENPGLIASVVGVERLLLTDVAYLQTILSNELGVTDPEVKYQNGGRQVRKSVSVDLTKTNGIQSVIRTRGIYLITGGMGALGYQLATYLEREYDAICILTGRTVVNGTIQTKLARLKNASYHSLDVSVKEELEKVIASIKHKYGVLNGVFHCAGVIKDARIANKNAEQVKQVLDAKIRSARNLDECTRYEKLDCFVAFSSLAALTGNAGQADYAAANAFLDDLAEYRQELVLQGKRSGQTLSVNWPLWEEGMQPDANVLRYLLENAGLLPMPVKEGMECLLSAMQAGTANLAVHYGYPERWRITGIEYQNDKTSDTINPLLQNQSEDLKTFTLNFLTELFAKELGIEKERIESGAEFEKYGLDSVLITSLSDRLDAVFGKVPRTLFFEHKTLNSLTAFFVTKYSDILYRLFNVTNDKTEPVKMLTNGKKSSIEENDQLSSSFSKSRFNGQSTVPVNAFQKLQSDAGDIAIIGLSGKYPGASNLSQFWDNLKQGKDSITEIPSDRWDLDDFYDPEPGKEGKSYSKWGGFISDIDKFDPLFFNISPREAELIDPQERLFLQVAWETIEDAGYTRHSLGSRENPVGPKVGVYVGVMYEEYALLGLEERLSGNPVHPTASPGSIANRVSYAFNFSGPSMAIDTMCSSSLTAIHLACNDLRSGATDYAIAGGVNVSVHPGKYQLLSNGRFISAKGRCESFGEGGIGYVPGEGVGAVLLKPLSKAIQDGDHVYGIVRASSLNHGGKTNGYSVPNPVAQGELIAEALNRAAIHPEQISYIEAHGTGTSLGDPIEIAGLTRAFASGKKQFCRIGSVKSNIGHCESAAGISGLTKVLLQLKYKQLVPSLHSRALNPNIDFEDTPFVVQQALEAWAVEGDKPRLAGISSFGAGGSNAHLIIEEYKVSNNVSAKTGTPCLFLVSAKTKAQRRLQVIQLLTFLKQENTVSIEDVTYTMQVGREAMEERLTFMASNKQEAIVCCEAFLENEETERCEVAYVRNLRAQVNVPENEIARLLNGKSWNELKDFWLKGVEIDWIKAYNDENRRRISLPLYPFAKDRYWIPKRSNSIDKEKKKTIHPLVQFEE